MSLYADYKSEREGKHTIESDNAFAVYSFGKDICYIEDVYVRPEFRRSGMAKEMVNWIADKARQKGCKKIMVEVTPSKLGSHSNVLAVVAYGMYLHSSQYDAVFYVKEI